MKKIFGKYELLMAIAADAISETWLALDTAALEEVNLVMFGKGFFAAGNRAGSFVDAYLSIAHLQHPNLADYLDYGVLESTPFFVMSQSTGQSLRHWLDSGELASLHDRIGWIIQATQGLLRVQEAGLSHGGLCPENIWLNQRGEIRISHFGVRSPSFHYTAPEAISGSFAQPQSDIFAIGAILYEVVTWQKPFNAPNEELIEQIQHYQPKPLDTSVLPGLDRLQEFIFRCLSKNKDIRPSSFPQVAAELEIMRAKFFKNIDWAEPVSLLPGAEMVKVEGVTAPSKSKATTKNLLDLGDDFDIPEPQIEDLELSEVPTEILKAAPTAKPVQSEVEFKPDSEGMEAKPASANKTPLFIAAGVGVLAVISVVMIFSGGPDNPPAETKPTPVPTVAAVQAPKPTPTPPPQVVAPLPSSTAVPTETPTETPTVDPSITPEPTATVTETPNPQFLKDNEEIIKLMDEFKRANEAMDVDILKSIWPSLSAKKEQQLWKNFSQLTSQKMNLTVDKIQHNGSTGIVYVTVEVAVELKNGTKNQIKNSSSIKVRKDGDWWVIND